MLLTIYLYFSLIFSQINLIAENGLTGSIPTKVGLLTELMDFNLCKCLFSVLLLLLMKDEFYTSNFFSLTFSHITLIGSNELTGSIPTEVGSLTLLEYLHLCK